VFVHLSVLFGTLHSDRQGQRFARESLSLVNLLCVQNVIKNAFIYFHYWNKVDLETKTIQCDFLEPCIVPRGCSQGSRVRVFSDCSQRGRLNGANDVTKSKWESL
jgi:hypothetical protein